MTPQISVYYLFLLLSLAVNVSAAPAPTFPRRSSLPVRRSLSTHNTRTIGRRGLRVEPYHPSSHYEIFGAAGLAAPALPKGKMVGDPLQFSTSAFISSRLGVEKNNVYFKAGYTVGKTKYAYARQSYHGIPFANAVANIAFANNKVVAFGSSFVEPAKLEKLLKGRPKGKAKSKSLSNSNSTNSNTIETPVSVSTAIQNAEDALDGKYNNHPTSLEWLVKDDGEIALTHVVQIQNLQDKGLFEWYEVFVDANDGSILSVTDFVKDATYTVLPITKTDLTESQETVNDPQDLLASPWGWHNDGETNSTDTSGNNVYAFKRLPQTNSTVFTNTSSIPPSNSLSQSNSSANLIFNYPYNPSIPATDPANIDSARTNAFYLMNMVHDITYRYGFTESAFNFQVDNMGKGGVGGDPVLVSVQDASGVNNANFATPPDGQPGVCRMYIWTLSVPKITQDGSLENDIPVHEMMHGVTNRMTGGGTGRCLDTVEAGGLGEGWSDAMAGWVKAKEVLEDVVIGKYVTGKAGGLRKYPYSTDESVNPLRYSDLKTKDDADPHVIGEIWANMLHNMLANLIEAYGFSSTAFTNPDGPEGNVVFLHLLMDALALQPCNPTFIDARNAWIQADINRYNGTNKCLIWKTFASRGLGVDAKDHVDGVQVPQECARDAPTSNPSGSVSVSVSVPTSTPSPSSSTVVSSSTDAVSETFMPPRPSASSSSASSVTTTITSSITINVSATGA